MLQKLIALQQSVYEGNKARGFWEAGKNRNKGEAVMLIITELSEAVESHRKGCFAQDNLIALAQDDLARLENVKAGILALSDHESIKEAFHDHGIKDSVEDELADAVIRILDTTYGFGWSIEPSNLPYVLGKPFEDNFAANVLRVVNEILEAYHSTEWNKALPKIIFLAEHYAIDLLWHVKAKLQYNATRPFKHGKAY